MMFEQELAVLINKHSLEGASDTPDYILASFLSNVFNDWNHAVRLRDGHVNTGTRLRVGKVIDKVVPFTLGFDHRHQVGTARIVGSEESLTVELTVNSSDMRKILANDSLRELSFGYAEITKANLWNRDRTPDERVL